MIDSHHHLWDYNPAEYGWISADKAVLRRSFRAAELDEVLSGNGITGAVAVQARRCAAENEFLLGEAAASSLIRGIVGWVDLKSPAIADELDPLAAQNLFKGVREIIQGQPDAEFLANAAFDRGLRELAPRGLTYDLLIFQDQLPAALEFVRRHADQPMVIDHAAKPEIRATGFPQAWEKGIRALARMENICCKISGLSTEVRDGLGEPDLFRRYFDVLLDAFGPGRLMFGSDWPVSLLGTSYTAWREIVAGLLETLTAGEKEAIRTGTATRFYGLKK